MQQKFNKTKLSPSSKEWLTRQGRDLYARQAKEENYRSRSAYKILQIDAKDKIFHNGDRVVDLGAAPGGWAQVAVAKVGSRVGAERVFAVDLLPVTGIPGAKILQGDCLSAAVRLALGRLIAGGSPQGSTLDLEHLQEIGDGDGVINPAFQVDVVLSDMSPNISGVRYADNANAEELWMMALIFAKHWLKPRGKFVCKLFQSTEAEKFVRECRTVFDKVFTRKPEASRDESREVFLVAIGKKP